MVTLRLGDKRATGASQPSLLAKPFYLRGSHMTQFIKKFVKDESGATAIEYGLIAALIAVLIITAVGLVGTRLEAVFNAIADGLAL